MATTWVLRTDTKGTGAQMVPLESVQQHPAAAEPIFVPRKGGRHPEQQPCEPRAPHRFRIVDVMTRQAMLEDGSTRATIEALKEVRSIVDVNVYVWHEERDRWRLLTFAEQRALLELART